MNYAYGNGTWKDLLTSYDGDTITYDTIGNPLTYRDGMTMTWVNGRQLSTLTKDGTTSSYEYDMEGNRIKKVAGGVTTEYYLNEGTIVAEKKGSNVIRYLFDENGGRYGFDLNGAKYYYVFNGQGDVVGVANGIGNEIARYTYDSWGKLLSVRDYQGNDKSGDATFVGNINPIRYRGYYYDAESGLYYLNSRYYDPETGRFINADGVMDATGDSVQGYNVFVYCFNNPINMSDDSGHWPKWLENAANWVNEKIVQPVKKFVSDVVEDIKNFDINNQSEEKALESNYFSAYKGVPVVRIGGERSGSFGAIFLTRSANEDPNPEDVVRHEYGHTKQLQQLGIVKYAIDIGIPSASNMGGSEYYNRPWEITADIYGGVQSRQHTKEDIEAGFSYLERSKRSGPFIWLFMD